MDGKTKPAAAQSVSDIVEHIAAVFLASTGYELVGVSGMVFTWNDDGTVTIATTEQSSITLDTARVKVVNDG